MICRGLIIHNGMRRLNNTNNDMRIFETHIMTWECFLLQETTDLCRRRHQLWAQQLGVTRTPACPPIWGLQLLQLQLQAWGPVKRPGEYPSWCGTDQLLHINTGTMPNPGEGVSKYRMFHISTMNTYIPYPTMSSSL